MSQKNIALLIIALFAIGVFFYYVIRPAIWAYRLKGVIQQRKNLILEETNHKELLTACRNIMENHTDYLEYDDPNWPLVIKQLKPSYVRVVENELHIEMGGGHFSFGVTMCEDEVAWPYYEHMKLLDDLWYYEEE